MIKKKLSYACHIYGLNGHKMTNCPKFIKMQKMFHRKSMTVIEDVPWEIYDNNKKSTCC
jgi:hypothetical protein